MFHGWDNFFVMAGTSAATLIGLLFVAVTVGTGISRPGIVHGTRGYLTPTLVHFGGVLFLALAVLAPWPSARPLAYQIQVVLMRQKVGFILPSWYDWLPWVGLPALGNASLIAGAVGLIGGKAFTPYAVAGASALLLLAGIYGAWDLTLWMVKNRDKT